MNINPQIWGRQTWDFFYFVALSYPKNPTSNDKLRYRQFFTLSGSVIPCDKCKVNFSKHLELIPIENYLKSSYDLFTWVTKMDNKIRVLHGKSEKSVDETFQYYMNKTNNDDIFNFDISKKEKILIGLGIIILFLFLIKKFKF